MHELQPLRFSPMKAYFLVPLLSIISGLIFAVCLYWSTNLKIKFLYKRNVKLEQATHIMVRGNENFISVVPLYSSNLNNVIDTFCYRFVQFKLNDKLNRFEPIMYPVTMPQKQIIDTLIGGLPQVEIESRRKMYGPC